MHEKQYPSGFNKTLGTILTVMGGLSFFSVWAVYAEDLWKGNPIAVIWVFSSGALMIVGMLIATARLAKFLLSMGMALAFLAFCLWLLDAVALAMYGENAFIVMPRYMPMAYLSIRGAVIAGGAGLFLLLVQTMLKRRKTPLAQAPALKGKNWD